MTEAAKALILVAIVAVRSINFPNRMSLISCFYTNFYNIFHKILIRPKVTSAMDKFLYPFNILLSFYTPDDKTFNMINKLYTKIKTYRLIATIATDRLIFLSS